MNPHQSVEKYPTGTFEGHSTATARLLGHSNLLGGCGIRRGFAEDDVAAVELVLHVGAENQAELVSKVESFWV